MRRKLEAGRIGGLGVEWDALRNLLARETHTAMGRDMALTVETESDIDTVRAALALTGEARTALAAAGPPPLDPIPDLRTALDRARVVGAVLDGTELVVISRALSAIPALIAYGRRVVDVAPGITRLTGTLSSLPELASTLGRALDDEGAVTDQASPRIGQVRREIRTRRRRIVHDLERMLHGPDAERLFAEMFVTVRHGRYVVPVRAESRSRVRGIVHDRSQSGQTLFVEPADVVDANNDLVGWIREEDEETQRILAELTDAVRERLAALDGLVARIAEADWVFARAATADRMDATAPSLERARRVRLRAARHPLLVAQSWSDPSRPVVPMDIELDADRPLLLITGPNAGGKTVALKTLGLSALMVQVGCHVPAADGSELPVFDPVFAVIGDDQSVAENLSTFSAFARQARDILSEARAGALVLLDELGAGTDPDEGAALARAILEQLDASGALVVATTHLEPLKTFASTHPRARNASVEFDADRLAPTFRLRYDRPGQSYALAIAERLGLPPDVIDRARLHRSADAARMSELLARLDQEARREAGHAAAAETQARETALKLNAARQAESAAETRARTLVEDARREAAALLADVRRAVNIEWERLRRAERSKHTLDESRRRLREVSARLTSGPDARTAEGPPTAERHRALVAGARVSAEHLGLSGEIVSIAGSTATVRSGAITVRVPLAALRSASAAPATPAAELPQRGTIRVPDRRNVGTEIHLLGRTTDEARDLVEQYLDDAFVAGLGRVRLIHGKGTGALRKAVRDVLTAHPLVASFRDGEPSEGGAGATVAELKVS